MRTIVFFLLFLVSFNAHAVNLGPFKLTVPFCERVQNISQILNSYTNVQWPVTGVPGVAWGLVQNTSVVLDMCQYIIQLEQLDNQRAIFFTANYLNTLTERKWNDHIQQMNRTWDLANTVYDFEGGQFRPGALKSKQTHRTINDFYKETYKYYNKNINGKDVELKTQGERQRDLNSFARLSYRRAILQDALNCPGGNKMNGNKDYEKILKTEIQPREDKKLDAQDNYTFFRQKLLQMGPKFSNTQEELDIFIKEMDKLMTAGVEYEIKTQYKTEATTRPGTMGKDGVVSAPKKDNIRRPVQSFDVKTFPELFEKFKQTYVPKWTEWVTIQVVSRGSRGLLVDPRGRIEDEFRDLRFECSPQKLMRGIPTSRADYQKLREERVERCKVEAQMNQKEAENLLGYYVDQFRISLTEYKKMNAYIWTQESIHLGTTRAVSQNSNEGFTQEQVTCAEKMSPAEMQKLGLKQQQVEAELAEQQAIELKKQTTMMQMAKEQDAQYVDEMNKRREFAETLNKENQHQLNNPLPMTGIKGTP